jgi:hypothetical protein
MNEPLFLESAQALALRTLKEGGTDNSQRLAYAFQLCVSRPPSAKEQDLLLTMLDKQRQRLSNGWLSARELTGFELKDKSPLPPNLTPVDWGAWTTVARVLLNLDETITKE